jgi:hypothetical protein
MQSLGHRRSSGPGPASQHREVKSTRERTAAIPKKRRCGAIGHSSIQQTAFFRRL